MPLTATFAADLDAFTKSIERGIVTLQTFERATKTGVRAVARELESISGQRLAVEATRMAESIKRLGGEFGIAGGLAKLLPDELQRVQRTIERTAEKATLLGETLPPSLRALRDEVSKLPKPTDDAAISFGKLVASYVSAEAIVGGVTTAFQAYVGFLRESLSEFIEAEAAQSRLTAAMRAQGLATPEVAAQYAALTRQFAQTTTFSGDLLTEMQALLVQVGDVMPSQMEDALRAATDLSAGLGIDLRTATEAVAKALEGNTGSLQRYGIAIDAASLAAKGADAVFEGIARRVGGQAAAEVGTYAGQLQQLAEAWRDLQEAVGRFLAESPEVMGAVGGLNLLLQDMTRDSGEAKTALGQLWDVWNEVITLGGQAEEIPMLNAATKALRELAHQAEAARARAAALAKETPFQQMGQDLPRITAGMALFTQLAEQDAEARQRAVDVQRRHNEALSQFGGQAAIERARELIRVLHDLGGPTKVLPSQLATLSAAFREAAAAAQTQGHARLAHDYELLSRTMDPVIQFQQRWNVTIGEFVTRNPSYTEAIREQLSLLERQPEAIHLGILAIHRYMDLWSEFKTVAQDPPGAAARKRWWEIDEDALTQQRASLRELGQAFSQLAQVTDSELVRSLAEVANQMAIGAEAGALFRTSLRQLTAGGIANTIAGLQSMVSAALAASAALASATDQAGRGRRAASGAAVGAQIGGSIVPGYGHLIGAGVGALVGALRNPSFEDVMERVGRGWGVKISEGLARGIADTAKTLFQGNRQAAELFSLDQILGEAGGLDAGNLDRFTRRLRDVFSLIETRQFTIAQGARVLEENWRAFADAGTDASGRLSEGLREILLLHREFGIEVRGITEYLAGQAAAAINGFSAAAEGMVDPWIALGEEIAETRTAIEAIENGRGSGNLNELVSRHAELLAQQASEAERAGQALSDLGVIALSTYGAAIDAGSSHAEAIGAALPGLSSLAKAYEALGLSIDDVGLASLLLQGTLLEKNPQLVAGIDGLSQSMIGLHNMGLLNVDTFAAMQRLGVQMYTRLQGEVAALDGETRDALLPMQGFLQEAAKQAQLLGIPLDANLQILIDQSKALGVWQEQGKTVTQLMLDGMERLNVTMERLVALLGGEMPRSAGDAERALRDLVNRSAPGLEDLADRVRDIIEERSPTGLEGVATYAGYAADAIVEMARRAAPALDRLSGLASSVAAKFERFAGTSVVRGLTGALSALRAIQRDDLQDAANFGLAKFQGSGGLTGKLSSLSREVQLLGLTDLPKELRGLAFQLQDEIAALGPNPDLYAEQWERARQILQSSLRFQLEDLELARKDEIAALGRLPADYAREYTKSLAKLEADFAKTNERLQLDRQKDLQDLARVAAQYGITKAEALALLERQHADAVSDARDRFDEERERLGMTPAEYAEAYGAAAAAVNEQYAQLKRRAEERAQFEIDQLGLLPDEYRRQYDSIVQLVGQKYQLMADAAATSAGQAIDSWAAVVEAYKEMFKYLPGMPGSSTTAGGRAYSLNDAIADAQAFALANVGHTLSAEQLGQLQSMFSGELTKENVQRFLEQALAQHRAGTLYLDSGGLVPRGSDRVPAMLTPGEAVLSTQAVDRLTRGDWPRSGEGVTQVIYVMLDGQILAEQTAQHLPRVLELRGVR
jgi:hypothetical protein